MDRRSYLVSAASSADECLVDAGLRFRNVYHFENIERIAMGFDLDSFHNGVFQATVWVSW
jgi:hypothetical protein